MRQDREIAPWVGHRVPSITRESEVLPSLQRLHVTHVPNSVATLAVMTRYYFAVSIKERVIIHTLSDTSIVQILCYSVQWRIQVASLQYSSIGKRDLPHHVANWTPKPCLACMRGYTLLKLLLGRRLRRPSTSAPTIRDRSQLPGILNHAELPGRESDFWYGYKQCILLLVSIIRIILN